MEVSVFLPSARGPLTVCLLEALRVESGTFARWPAVGEVTEEDLHLALWTCYELHYRGFDGVDAGWEWDSALLSMRAELEARFVEDLVTTVAVPAPDQRSIAAQLSDAVRADDGPSLSRYLQSRASREQFEEFVVHRSVYHLKEADPHSWGIPRLAGRAKAALVEIQADEYGSGSAARMHSELFRATMRCLGLDDTYGRYVDRVPAVTLAVSNLMSLFGLHRAWRGALVGHLAAFEMTSSQPNRRYSKGLARVGGDQRGRRFYDEHVTADALHEQIAAHDLCGGLVEQEPALAADVLFGAACALHMDNAVARHLLGCWAERRTSLRTDADALTMATSDAG
jgi:Iron-containing redox enzyme